MAARPAPAETAPAVPGRRPATGEKVVARSGPALVLVLDEATYDPERHVVDFRLRDGSRMIAGELSLAALQSLAAAQPAGAIADSLISGFRRMADVVRRIAEWKYAVARPDPEDRLEITTADLIEFAAGRRKPRGGALRANAPRELAPVGRPIHRSPAELADQAL